MNKCLVTKLQASCSAMENPQYFGKAEITIKVANDGIHSVLAFIYLGGNPITFELIEGSSDNWEMHDENVINWITRVGNKITLNNPKQGIIDSGLGGSNYTPLKFNKAGTYKIRFDKYYCAPYISNSFDFSFIKIKDMKYLNNGVYMTVNYTSNNCFEGDLNELVSLMSPNATSIGVSIYPETSGVHGNISSLLKLEKLTAISLGINRLIEGNINILNNHKNKNNISFIRLNNIPLLTGDIVSAFGGYISLNSLYIENNKNITGSIEELAQAQVNNGRTTGSLTIKGYAINVVPNPGASGKTITFTSDGYTIS